MADSGSTNFRTRAVRLLKSGRDSAIGESISDAMGAPLKSALKDVSYQYQKARWTDPAKPLLVYQMGKVASSSVFDSLKNTTDFDVWQVHRMSPANIARVQAQAEARGSVPPNDKAWELLYTNVVREPKVPVRIISLFREPISRNFSAYFQNLETFQSKGAHKTAATDELIQGFIEGYDHSTPLTWFDDEMRSTTAIDVYATPFPKADGFQVIDAAPYHLLNMRHDLDDAKKEEVIADFLGLPSFTLTNSNEGAAKAYSDAYREFVKTITIPPAYAAEMLGSKYVKHFFSDDEVRAIYEKWAGEKLPAAGL